VRRIWASASGKLNVVQTLLAKGAEVNAKANDGETALMRASASSYTFGGRLDVVQALFANGAEVNAAERFGRTALMMASESGILDVVQALLAKGAEVNAKANDFRTSSRLQSVCLRLTSAAPPAKKVNHEMAPERFS
jgi:uncharacterized protein